MDEYDSDEIENGSSGGESEESESDVTNYDLAEIDPPTWSTNTLRMKVHRKKKYFCLYRVKSL